MAKSAIHPSFGGVRAVLDGYIEKTSREMYPKIVDIIDYVLKMDVTCVFIVYFIS